MPITRRALLASLAAVAAAKVAPALTEREAFYLVEHKWATQGLMLAVRRQDSSPWEPSANAAASPRWRLARALIGLCELTMPTSLERVLQGEILALWNLLTRPDAYASRQELANLFPPSSGQRCS